MKTSGNFSRRDFIRAGAIGAGALALVNPFDLFAAKPAKKLGIALVGLGYYSYGQLAPALQHTQNCYLAGIVTGHPAKAAAWQKQYNIPEKNTYNYETFDQIAHNPDIDIIYVVLPVSMHKEYTIRAAKAGKHVICEKPMALNANDCQEMITECKKADRLLSIGYRLHFEPHTLEIMKLGQKQVYGKVKSIDTGNGFTYRGDPNAWRLKKAMAGGGGLMDMGIYSIQGTRYTLGQEPIAVTATQEKTRPDFFKEVDETIFWELEFPGGFVAKGKSSYNHDWSYLHVEAERGKFGLEPAFGYGGIDGYTSKGPMNLPQIIQQAAQMDDFANCVMQNKQSRVPGEEGLKDMKVVDAIYRSLDSGKKRKDHIMADETNTWPGLAFENWKDTLATVHLWTQIVGKIRLKQMPWLNHSWHVTLYVSANGLTTGSIPYKEGVFQIDFDFIHHAVHIITSASGVARVQLYPRSVADFYRELFDKLESVNIDACIYAAPNEVDPAIPFAKDETHKSYDAEQMHNFYLALVKIHNVFTRFRASFTGKCSPVHFFWGAFDMAVTRFSGRPAPLHPGGAPNIPKAVMQEAYSHEVSSCGFWPGSDQFPHPVFYSYCYPTPPDFSKQPVKPNEAFFSGEMGEFMLLYEVVQRSDNPEDILMQFLQTTYEAAANTGHWDRKALECDFTRFER